MTHFPERARDLVEDLTLEFLPAELGSGIPSHKVSHGIRRQVRRIVERAAPGHDRPRVVDEVADESG
jgi:hypothetical protein